MMSKFLRFFKLYRWPILSGALIGTSYAPFPCWAVLFCYVPLWLFASDAKVSLKQVFWGAWLTQFVLTLIGFHWVIFVIHDFGYIPWPLAAGVLLIFCSLVHLYIPIATVFAVWIARRLGLSRPLLLILLAFILNILERLWPSIFPWNLGYALFYSKLPMYQWADVLGFLGLSLIVLLSNAVLAIWWLQRKKYALIAVVAAVWLAMNLSGSPHAEDWQKTDSKVEALIVQGNIGNFEKVAAEKGQEYQDEIINRFLALSKKGQAENPTAQVMIWPETAFPYYLDQRYLMSYYPQRLLQSLKGMNISLITGTYSREPQDLDHKSISYNAMAFIPATGLSPFPIYRKTHLLAYGEYLPFSEAFPILLTWVPMVSNFGRGQGPAAYPLTVGDQSILWGPQICYEGLYPEFSRDLAVKGAQIFVNTTNDSWYREPFEPQQHMFMTFARAIENRRPLIRSTNTGISSVILASGEVLKMSPLNVEWAEKFDVSYQRNPPLTFFSKWGHFDAVFVLLLTLATLAIGYRNARIRRP